MKIYVASSWRNNFQPFVVELLRRERHEVYDFKNSSEDWHGFHWSAIQEGWEQWTFDEYMNGLDHDLARKEFSSDMDAMVWADCCVLVLPCGRSAYLQLGWFVGQGKRTCILHHGDMLEPELMSKMCDAQFDDLADVVRWLRQL